MPQTFQQPQQPAPAAMEYILTIPETQMPASQPIQLTQQSQVATKEQQQPRGQLTSFLVVDDQQAGPTRLLTFTMTPKKHFNPPSVASATGEESQHNILGLSSFFGNLQSVMSYQQINTPQLFSPPDLHQPAASPITARTSAATSAASASLQSSTAVFTTRPASTSHLSNHSKNISSNQCSLSLLCSHPMPNSNSSRTTTLYYNRSFSGPLLSNI